MLASLFFTIRTDRFLTTENWSLIIQQVAVVGILAIGQTVIILTAGIDLSCGAVMAFGAIVMTRFIRLLGSRQPDYAAVFSSILSSFVTFASNEVPTWPKLTGRFVSRYENSSPASPTCTPTAAGRG